MSESDADACRGNGLVGNGAFVLSVPGDRDWWSLSPSRARPNDPPRGRFTATLWQTYVVNLFAKTLPIVPFISV